MMGSTELRAKLEWMANAKPGDTLPDWLGGTDHSWAVPMSEIAKAALDFVPDEHSVITLEGIRYAMGMFKLMSTGPLRHPFQVVNRDGETGRITFELRQLPTWRPVAEIETVMEPWTRDLPHHYRWRGLIQALRRGEEQPWIQEGWAYWFKSRHANSEPMVRWGCSNGLCTPEFFQAFPEARTDG